MNLHLFLASLAATLSLGIAAQASPAKVACVGDSITFGSGLKPGEARYPQVLATLMGPDFDVRGFGNPGKTAGDYPGQAGRWYGSTREHKQALDFKADIYICNLGINDTGRWWNPELFSKGYEALLQAWKNANPKARFFAWGLLGPDYRGPLNKKAFPGNCYPDVRKYAGSDNGSAANRPEAEKLTAAVARKYKVSLFDALHPLSDHPEWYVDGLHPTEQGARRIAEITFAKLAKSLKIKQPVPRLEPGTGNVIINNPGNSGILLDGWKLTDGSNTLIFENSTVIHPKDRLIIAIGPETQKDPTRPLQIKSAKSPAAFRLIPAKNIKNHWNSFIGNMQQFRMFPNTRRTLFAPLRTEAGGKLRNSAGHPDSPQTECLRLGQLPRYPGCSFSSYFN